MSLQQLMNTVLLFVIFEKPIFNFVCREKEDHIFALPFYKAQGDMGALNMLVHYDQYGGSTMNSNVSHMQKYAALNLRPLMNPGSGRRDSGGKGSIEFRMFPSTLDVDLLETWINMVMCLKKAAMGMTTDPADLPMSISKHGAEQFAQDVFGKLHRSLDYRDFVREMYDGIRLAQDIIFQHDAAMSKELEAEAKASKKKGGRAPFAQYMSKHNLTHTSKRNS